MGRGLHLAAVLVVASTGLARADGGHKVKVETEPPGANVYLNDTDSPPVCEPTPCTFDAPVGAYTIIVQLKNYTPKFEPLDVPKRPKKPLIAHFKLDPAIATIVIDSAVAKGASITVDGESKGKVNGSGNAKIEVEPGGHQVTVTLGGKNLFEEFIDVNAGEEVPINLKVAAAPPAPGDGEKTETDTSPPPHDETSITATPTPSKRNRFISGDVVVDVGFRRFTYGGATPTAMNPVYPEQEDGQVIGGPAVEFWPMELLGINHVRGLSLFAKVELPLNHQDVVDDQKPPQQLGQTRWMTIEASVRQRWMFAEIAGLEVSGGYVRDQLGFDADPAERMKLPDVDYQSIRLGVRGSLTLGPVEPYATFEERFVQSGGALAIRFQNPSVEGYRATIGIAARGGNFIGRVEASDAHYGWTLSQSSQPGFYSADSASDNIYGFAFMLGYQY
jgi:hypothetical protein